MKNNIIKYGFIFLLVCALPGCLDLDLTPTDKYIDDNYWTTADKAETFLNRAYEQMAGVGQVIRNEFLSDNCYDSKSIQNETTIVTGQANSANELFSSEWSNCYRGIKTCHILLENIDRVTDISEKERVRIAAEARFIRAFLYFRLTTWFGDVPFFNTNISVEESNTISRTAHKTVVDFIHQELDAIRLDLPTNKELTDNERGRITKGAAVALNARVYLYDNDYENVAIWCQKLINSDENGTYSLFPSYSGLFEQANNYNDEMILEIGYAYPRTWGEMFDYVPISCGARSIQGSPTQELVDNYIMLNGKAIKDTGSGYVEDNPYENRDPRMDATIVRHLSLMVPRTETTAKQIYIKPNSTTNPVDMVDLYGNNSTHTGYFYRKFYEPTMIERMQTDLNLPLIRFADVLLMYAEAIYETGKMDATVWGETIKALRIRAGFQASGALDYPGESGNLRDIIRSERRSEFALEGTRIFDIRRWKIAEEVLDGYPHGAKWGDPNVDNGYFRLTKRKFNPERDYLWPVPQNQLDINPNLGQNPNW